MPYRVSEYVLRNWPDVAKKIDSEEAVLWTDFKKAKR